MEIDHVCFECGFKGSVLVIKGKVTCPVCGSVNDVWTGKTPPVRHIVRNMISRIRGVNDGGAVYKDFVEKRN